MRLKNLLFAMALTWLATPLSSYALYYVGTVNIVVGTTSSAEAWAGYATVKVAPGNASLHGACDEVLYIAPEDKLMLAEALTAQVNGLPVSLYYNESAPSRNLAVTTSSCKIVWLSLE